MAEYIVKVSKSRFAVWSWCSCGWTGLAFDRVQVSKAGAQGMAHAANAEAREAQHAATPEDKRP